MLTLGVQNPLAQYTCTGSRLLDKLRHSNRGAVEKVIERYRQCQSSSWRPLAETIRVRIVWVSYTKHERCWVMTGAKTKTMHKQMSTSIKNGTAKEHKTSAYKNNRKLKKKKKKNKNF